jgi:predicted esterase
VIWEGQSTRHVTEAFRAAGLTQDQVRSLFTSISPASFVERFAAQKQRHVLMIYAPWDLTFPRHLSLEAIDDQRRHGLQPEVRVLPCGHYTTGETPFKYIDGWYMGSFVRRAFRAMAAQHHAAD